MQGIMNPGSVHSKHKTRAKIQHEIGQKASKAEAGASQKDNKSDSASATSHSHSQIGSLVSYSINYMDKQFKRPN